MEEQKELLDSILSKLDSILLRLDKIERKLGKHSTLLNDLKKYNVYRNRNKSIVHRIRF